MEESFFSNVAGPGLQLYVQHPVDFVKDFQHKFL